MYGLAVFSRKPVNESTPKNGKSADSSSALKHCLRGATERLL